MVHQEDVSALIKGIRLFAHLDESGLRALAQGFTHRRLSPGEEIFDQDDPSHELFVIVDGTVRIIRKGADGREVTLAVMKAGDFFGEIAMFIDSPRSAAAVAVDAAHLLVLDRIQFLEALRRAPLLAQAVIEEISRRLFEADKTIASLLWDSAYQKILLTLRRLVRKEGQQRGDAAVIKRRITHQEVADMAGTSRETASRILGLLKKRGAVVPSGKNVIVRESLFPPTVNT